MKKKLTAALLAALLLLSACAAAPPRAEGNVHIVATTYPVYLFTTALTAGREDMVVTLMIREPTSCLHDYTLTVGDMKTLTDADVVIMNGAGLEDFMADALAGSGAKLIDASAGIELLLAEGHEAHDGHDHDEEYDPHYWLDPRRAAKMADNIAVALGVENAVSERLEEGVHPLAGELASRELITFHDGFRYFADFLGLTMLKAIEEEAGSEASAKELIEVTELVRTHRLPAIFTEVNGSEATAKAVARETGVELYRLDMVMSGDGAGIEPYLDAMNTNIDTISEALS